MKKVDFESEAHAHELLTEGLSHRYGEDFVIVGDAGISYLNYSGEPLSYHANYAPVADLTKVFWAEITNRGNIADTYARYLFNEEAESRAAAPLAAFDFIERLEVELRPKVTGRVWTESDSIESYMRDGSGLFDPWVNVRIWLSDGCTSEEQAQQMKECMDALYDVGFGIEVRFYTDYYGGEELYMRKFAASPDPSFRPEVEYYLRIIMNMKTEIDNERAEATADTHSQESLS